MYKIICSLMTIIIMLFSIAHITNLQFSRYAALCMIKNPFLLSLRLTTTSLLSSNSHKNCQLSFETLSSTTRWFLHVLTTLRPWVSWISGFRFVAMVLGGGYLYEAIINYLSLHSMRGPGIVGWPRVRKKNWLQHSNSNPNWFAYIEAAER